MKRTLLVIAILAAVFIPVSPLWGEAAPSPARIATDKEASVKTAPVLLERNPIFSVPGYHALTAQERAARISERIAKVAEDYTIRSDAIKSVDSEVLSEIMAGDRVIMSLYDSDARPFEVTRQVLAAECAKKIGAAIEQYRQDRSSKNISRGILLSGVATLVLLAAFLLVRFLFRKLQAAVEEVKIGSIHFQKFELLRIDQIKVFLVGLIRALRLVIVLVLLYAYVQLTLSFFPWTRPFSGEVLKSLLVPLKTMEVGIIAYIPNMIFLAVLAVVTCYVLKFMRLFAVEVEKGNITFPGFYREWAKPTYKIARFLLIVFVGVVAFPYFPGSQSPAFKGISIFLGVLLSLGSSSTVSNVIAGLDMTYRRAYLTGDWIKIGDLTGEVTRMRLLVTHLRTFKNEEVVFPNALLLNSHVTNFSFLAREQGLILHTSVTIGYSTPWRQVHAFLLQAAERTPGLLKSPPPFVLQTALDDFYVRYELNAYTDAPQEMLTIYSDLHQNIQDAFNEFEVQIMSPHYVLDPRSPAIVPKEQWYKEPAKAPGNGAGERTEK